MGKRVGKAEQKCSAFFLPATHTYTTMSKKIIWSNDTYSFFKSLCDIEERAREFLAIGPEDRVTQEDIYNNVRIKNELEFLTARNTYRRRLPHPHVVLLGQCRRADGEAGCFGENSYPGFRFVSELLDWVKNDLAIGNSSVTLFVEDGELKLAGKDNFYQPTDVVIRVTDLPFCPAEDDNMLAEEVRPAFVLHKPDRWDLANKYTQPIGNLFN